MRNPLLLLAAGGAALALLQPALAAPADVDGAQAAEDDAFGLLRQAADAAQALDYHGTEVVLSWSYGSSTSAMIEVLHHRGAGLLLRVAPTPQSSGGTVLDDETTDVVGFEKGTLALIADNYEAAVEGHDAVAGRSADVVVVRRPGQSPTARFWLDSATHLALRREVLDTDGRRLRVSAYIDIDIGAVALPPTANTAVSMPAVAGVPVDLAALRTEGWQVPDRLAGGLELFAARRITDGGQPVVQLSYSDGLSTVSLFQQRGRLDTGAVAGWQRDVVGGRKVWVQSSYPRRVVWYGRGTVFTIVAECPSAVLDDLVGALPYGSRHRGVARRLGHGLARVGSWLNPFS